MNDTISAILVDDEPLARELLRSFIEKEQDFRVVGECGDGESALRLIEENTPDVVFLDIEMPRLDGMSVVRRLGEMPRTPHIVFVTAYDQYAIDAFELNALDYLVKPLSRKRCSETIERARQVVRNENIVALTDKLLAVVQGIEASSSDNQAEQKIIVRKHDELRAVPLSNIVWVEADNQYVNIHTTAGRFVMSESLGRFAERLRDSRFVRIHRSAIVNGHHVVRVTKNSNGTHNIETSDATELTLARARSSYLQKILHLAGNPST